MKTSFALGVACLVALLALPGSQAATARGARTVRLSHEAPAGTVFYNELTVKESQRSTYFGGCGFHCGHLGIQEQVSGEPQDRVVVFSVWNLGRKEDTNEAGTNRRVEVLHQGKDVTVVHFGKGDIGGQSFFKYPWKTNETCRFMVRALTNQTTTAYAAYFFLSKANQWKHLVTFRIPSQGEPLRGYSSFIEDFRRDGKSQLEPRRALYGNGWVQSVDGQWLPLTNAVFLADRAPLLNIDAGVADLSYSLATGGSISNQVALRSTLNLPAPPRGEPPTDVVNFKPTSDTPPVTPAAKKGRGAQPPKAGVPPARK